MSERVKRLYNAVKDAISLSMMSLEKSVESRMILEHCSIRIRCAESRRLRLVVLSKLYVSQRSASRASKLSHAETYSFMLELLRSFVNCVKYSVLCCRNPGSKDFPYIPKMCSINMESLKRLASKTSSSLALSYRTSSHMPDTAFSPNRCPFFALPFVKTAWRNCWMARSSRRGRPLVFSK